MGIGSGFLREQLVFVLDIVSRRWRLFCLPVLVASVLSYVAMGLAPTKYTASSVILLQAANRNVGSFSGVQHTNTVEQVQAIEAWLKSDQVLAELVPQMTTYKPPKAPIERIVQMRRLAASLSLEVVGNSVLQIKLEGDRPEGLGRNLETVLSRMMEGLTGPEQNILSAPQFVNIRRSEEAAATEAALMKAIAEGGFQAPLQVRADLDQLRMLTRQGEAAGRRVSGDAGGQANDGAETAADRLRRSISEDPEYVARLERLYAAYREAVDKQAALKVQAGPGRSNYVSIFSSPEDLLIIGRPKDPIVGESAARKLAIAGVLVSVIGGAGLVLLAELLSGVLRTRRDHEAASGLPVLARLPKLSH
jgi:capsular polysaccharide biosynthesis protein